MNFRKLLAFILVFSLATQPGGVRFSYAEDTKAAEVKIEKKTEVSDGLAIELDETELDEYLFDPGSREQKLEEAATVAAKETAKTGKISGALAGAIAAGVAAVTAAVGAAGLMIYNGVSNKDEIAKLWTSEEDSFFSRLGKTVSILFKGANKVPGEQVEVPVVKENTEPLGEEPTQSDEKTQPTGIDSVDKSLCDEGKLDKEYCDKLEEKLQAKVPTEAPVEETTPVVEEKPCKYGENEETLTCDAELKQEISSLEDYQQKEAERLAKEEAERKAKEEAERLAKEEAERKAMCPLSKKANDLIKKKNRALNTLNQLENTCGFKKFGLKSKLDVIDLWTLTTPEELAQAESKLNLIVDRINALRGKCSDIKSKKDYIEKNWQAAVSILDSSDASLRNAWDTLNLQQVTVGNLKELAEEHTTIAGRVRTIIKSNNKISKLTGEISKGIWDNKNAAWIDKDYYNEQLYNLRKKTKTEEGLVRIFDELDLLYDKLQKNYSKKAIKAVNKAVDEFDDSELVKYFESEECSASDNEDRYEPYEELVKPLIAKKNEIIAAAKKNHSLNGVVEKLEELQANERSVVQKIRSLNRNTKAANDAIKQYEGEAWFDKAHFEEWLQGATKDKIATEADLELRANNVAAILNDLKTNFSKKEIKVVNQKINSLKNSDLLKGDLGDDYADLRSSVESSMGQVIAAAKKNHSLNGVVEKVEELQVNERSVVQKIHSLNRNTKAANDVIRQYEGEAYFDKAHFEERLQGATKDKIATEADLDLRVNNVAAILNDLKTNYSEKDVKAVNKKISSLKNSDLLKGDLGDDYADLRRSVESLMGQVIAEAKKNHSLNGVVEKLEELQANERSVVQKIRSLNKNIKAANDAIKQYEGEAWFDKAHFEEWMQGATKDKIATEADLELRVNNVAAILNDLETNFSKKEIKAVNEALDEIDNSAFVKGTRTQSRLFGWKEENKLTSEQCNTLKDKFVAERDRLVEEAKSSHSVVGLAQKLKNLYGKTDEYINDVAKLNADASEIEEIINEAGKFGLIDTEYFNNKLEENKDYSLDDLKSQRKAMGEFLSSLKTNFSEKNLNTLNSLDSEINKLISDFGEYKASYVSQYKEKYAAKCEELKEMHDAGKAVAELEKYKDDLQTKLDKVKTFCKNNPAKCGKQEKGE